VLDFLADKDLALTVIVQEEWVEAFRALRPNMEWTSRYDGDALDLDAMTCRVHPSEHRTEELARMLGIHEPMGSARIEVPEEWKEPFGAAQDAVIFAPEGGHASRCWPLEFTRQLKEELLEENLILVGQSSDDYIPCDVDTRGQLELTELLGLLAVANAVITMDSGVLHLATALSKPTVAIFGGIDPKYRIKADQPAVALRADMACCPCNKHERCNGSYSCIAAIEPGDVIAALELARQTNHRIIMPVAGGVKPAAMPIRN